MRFDYHMHLEYGSYDADYAEGFFHAAAERLMQFYLEQTSKMNQSE